MLARSPNRASDGAERLRAPFVVEGLSFNRAVCLAAAVAPRFGRAGAIAELFSLFPVDAERRVPVDPSVRVTRGTDLASAVEQWVPRRLRRRTYAVHRRADASICISDALVPPVLAAKAADRFDIGLTAASLVDLLRPLRRNCAGAERVTAAPASND